MKIRNILSIIAIALAISSFAQPWLQNRSNNLNELSLREHQQAFEDFWAGKDVQNGKYIENGIEKKAYGWKQFKRWENYWRTRVNPQDSKFPTSLQYKNANQEYELSSIQNRSLTGQWTNLGPSSSGGGYAGVGRISTVAFHPTDANTYWVGAPTGGLWKTSDNGSSWTVLTDQNDVLGVSAIAITSDYSSSQTLYIGTGDRDSWHHDNGNGIFKSTDGGASWTVSLPFNVALGYTVNQLLIHPSNNNILYAATTDGIYKTTDAGANWTNIYDVNYISDLEFNPSDPSILYATSKWYGTIYKLINDGASGTQVYNDADANRIELTVTADNPNLVYAIVSNSDYGLKGILKSTDQGDNFTFITDSPNVLSSASDGSGTSGQGWYDLALIADPQDQDILYAGGVNTWKSLDGGASWSIVNHWWGDGVQAVHADKHFFAYNNTTLYECNDGGMYRTDDGTTWENISNGIVNSQMYKLAVAQTEANQTITGLQDNGTKLFASGSWSDVVGGDGMNCEIDPSNAQIMYGGIQNGKIMRTTNAWNNSDYITRDSDGNPINGLDETGAWVTPYLINPNTPNELYIGLENVWKSTDRGDSWIKISNINTSDKLESIAISVSNDQVLYTADDNQIWVTTNDGASWTEITSGLPSSDITSITIKNDDPNTVWVSLGSFNSDAVYESTNGGSSWTNISAGLPNIPANAIVQNTQNTSETELYVGTDFGVYIKRGTANWVLFNTGMPKVTVCDLNIYYDAATPANSKIRAASWGRGLWESDLYTVATSAPVADFSGTPTNICADDTVVFTDLSTNTPTDWIWSISPSSGFNYINGTDANSQNPQIRFVQAGNYSITLSASNTGGSDDEVKNNYIVADAIPVADFSADQTTITEGETINFTDLSTNSPDAWLWSFTGGTPNSSSVQNPSISYNTAGTYQVQLTASKNACSDNESKTAYIQVNTSSNFPVADFSASETEICINNNITFTDLSTQSPNIWLWELTPSSGFTFINSTNENSQNPEIEFTQSGTYTVKLTATNNDGTDNEIKNNYITVNITPNQPSVITGATDICENSTEVYSVTNVEGTTYNWTLPTAWGGTSDTNSIAVTSNNTGGIISVTAENSCGISSEQTLSVNISPLPEAPIFDEAPLQICENSDYTYSVIYTGADSYNWTLPNDWTGNSITNSIDIHSGSGGNVSLLVNAENACGTGPNSSVSVEVKTVPMPVTINGPREVCNGVEATYSTLDIEGAIYHWQIPTGWTGNSSSRTIAVTNNGTAGEISVYIETECGIGPSSTVLEIFSINVINSVAEQASVISGPNPVCENTTNTYSVVELPGVTYYWNLPLGWSGSGNNASNTVSVGNTGGTITLVPFNACGMGISRTLNVSVNQPIGTISAITGNTEVCEGSTQSYSITAENASTYSWSMPSGWSGSSSYSNINTTVGNNNGNIDVVAENACGTSPLVSLPVIVNLLPVANFSYTNNQSEYTFTNLSENADSYSWDFGDLQTSTDVNPIHNYASSGSYNINLIAVNQCAQRSFYTTVNVTILDINLISNSSLSVFPNPTKGLINIKGLDKQITNIKVIDVTGRTLVEKNIIDASESISIDLSNYANGLYQVIIKQNNQIFNQSIVLQK